MSYIAVPKGTIVKTPWGDAIVTSTSVNVNVCLIDPKHGHTAGRSISESTLKQLNPRMIVGAYSMPEWPDPYQVRMNDWDARIAASRDSGRFDVV